MGSLALICTLNVSLQPSKANTAIQLLPLRCRMRGSNGPAFTSLPDRSRSLRRARSPMAAAPEGPLLEPQLDSDGRRAHRHHHRDDVLARQIDFRYRLLLRNRRLLLGIGIWLQPLQRSRRLRPYAGDPKGSRGRRNLEAERQHTGRKVCPGVLTDFYLERQHALAELE